MQDPADRDTRLLNHLSRAKLHVNETMYSLVQSMAVLSAVRVSKHIAQDDKSVEARFYFDRLLRQVLRSCHILHT
jgi:hypothetical protein